MAKKFLDYDGLAYVFTKIKTMLSGKASTDLSDVSDADFLSKAQAAGAGVPIVTTAGTGEAYTATVPGITALTAGATFIMVTHTVSTSATPTLNVNSLGAKNIKRRLSNIVTSVQSGYAASWLASGKPFLVTYDGTQWIVDGLAKPATADLYGTLAVGKGGTGLTTVTAGNFLVGNGTNAMTEKTPAEVLTAIGAAASGHNHAGQSINPAAVEINPGTGAGHGGYIDFHFDGDTGDYTSRLWEDVSGQLRVTGTLKVTSPGATTNAVRNIFANTSTPSAASAEGTIRLVYE